MRDRLAVGESFDRPSSPNFETIGRWVLPTYSTRHRHYRLSLVVTLPYLPRLDQSSSLILIVWNYINERAFIPGHRAAFLFLK